MSRVDPNFAAKVRPDWDAILQKYDVGWTILPQGHALNVLLALRKDWSLAYGDDVAAIYTRHPTRAAVSE